MTQTIQASAIQIDDLESKTGIQEVHDQQFFGEWQRDLPEIDDWEKQALDRLKTGYLNLLKKPPLLENAVRMAILHPLLFIAGLYLAPFQAKPEKSLTISLEDEDNTIVEGRMDILVLKEQFWLIVIESKRAGIAIEEGIAQLLAYMLGSPKSNEPIFGMITNGGSLMFAKLIKGKTSQYALSDMFVLRKQENELYQVLKILKRLAAIVESAPILTSDF
ncbi:MAG: restriction endonuclease subunit R [Cyanobacteria bacterium CRU_2_1]|nr:restriction endonuclease subunit R [Cyanobacteria bacterium RU_5_0]NJR61436.1 restriction endonuclease subunit R [Cyanobacteria bacterium CRU_2_1]